MPGFPLSEMPGLCQRSPGGNRTARPPPRSPEIFSPSRSRCRGCRLSQLPLYFLAFSFLLCAIFCFFIFLSVNFILYRLIPVYKERLILVNLQLFPNNSDWTIL